MERRSVFANNPQKLEELKTMYLTGKYNTEDLGNYFGTQRSTIRSNLIKLGIPIIRKRTKRVYLRDVNIDRIVELYKDNISIAQISKRMGVDRSVIESRLIDNGYDLSGIRLIRKYSGIESCYYKLYKKYDTNAKHRGYSFDLSEKDFFELLKGKCFYCGDEPKQIVTHNGIKTLYNGVDRVDNSKGYSKDNCVSCCWICNRFKLDLSQKELVEHVNKMYKNLNSDLRGDN